MGLKFVAQLAKRYANYLENNNEVENNKKTTWRGEITLDQIRKQIADLIFTGQHH